MDLETDFYYMILLKREVILSIIILKGGFQTIQLYLLSYSVRSDSPQLFFPGPHRQTTSPYSLRRTRSSPAALCMLV